MCLCRALALGIVAVVMVIDIAIDVGFRTGSAVQYFIYCMLQIVSLIVLIL